MLRTRLARLPDEAITVLTAGAIAGREFDVALVAHVCGIDEDRALDLVEAAWMTGIVDEAHDGLGHFRFSHELVRESAGRRPHVVAPHPVAPPHRRSDRGAARRAQPRVPHRVRAPLRRGRARGRRAQGRAVRPAGRPTASNAQLAYEDAIPTYERALELVEIYDVGSWQTRTDLLIGLGWALRATGRLGDARLALRRAMERARTEGDPVRIARAVLGIGGGGFWGWWDEFGVADLDLLAYLERALEALDDEDSVLRCELLARLAVEGYFATSRGAPPRVERRSARDGAPPRRSRRAHRRARVRAARQSGRPTTSSTGSRSTTSSSRSPPANSIAYGELIGRHFRMVDRLESGDRAAADADFAACEHLAERLGHYAFHVQLAWYRSMIAFVEGRLDDAERLIHDAFERNLAVQRTGGVDRVRRADVPPAARAGSPRRARRRHPRERPSANRTWRCALHTGLATIAGEHGRTDEARALLDPCSSPTVRSPTATT